MNIFQLMIITNAIKIFCACPCVQTYNSANKGHGLNQEAKELRNLLFLF